MAHQCVRCSRIIPKGSRELIEGCNNCKGKFFFYIRDEKLEEMKKSPPVKIPEEEKDTIEKDIRELAGITNQESPVVLDLESVRVTGEGKFELDVVNLFNKKRPLVYKFEEGKYVIDLSTTFGKNKKDLEE